MCSTAIASLTSSKDLHAGRDAQGGGNIADLSALDVALCLVEVEQMWSKHLRSTLALLGIGVDMWLRRNFAVLVIVAALGFASVSVTSPSVDAAESGNCGAGFGPHIQTDGLGHFAATFGFGCETSHLRTIIVTVARQGAEICSASHRYACLRSGLRKRWFTNAPPNSNATVEVLLGGTYKVASNAIPRIVVGMARPRNRPQIMT
jgi:hypothetical protein